MLYQEAATDEPGCPDYRGHNKQHLDSRTGAKQHSLADNCTARIILTQSLKRQSARGVLGIAAGAYKLLENVTVGTLPFEVDSKQDKPKITAISTRSVEYTYQ